MSDMPKLVISLEDVFTLFDAALDREDYGTAGIFADAVLSLNDPPFEIDADA